MAPSDSLKIGDAARLTGLSVDTVRYYEKSGLLGRVARRASGIREYDRNAVRRLVFIRQAARLGFSLAEIRGLLTLRVSSRTTCGCSAAPPRTRVPDDPGQRP